MCSCFCGGDRHLLEVLARSHQSFSVPIVKRPNKALQFVAFLTIGGSLGLSLKCSKFEKSPPQPCVQQLDLFRPALGGKTQARRAVGDLVGADLLRGSEGSSISIKLTFCAREPTMRIAFDELARCHLGAGAILKCIRDAYGLHS